MKFQHKEEFKTKFSCAKVSIAPGLTALTFLIASSAVCPCRFKRLAQNMPVRPSPAAQCTTIFESWEIKLTNFSLLEFHALKKGAAGADISLIGK